MTDPFGRLRRLLRELKRRNVYRVAVAYLAVAFVVVQGARLLVPALVLPEWFYRVVVALALIGFPLALVLAWAFEMTPEGVRRTDEAEEGAAELSPSGAGGWIVALLTLLVAGGGFWYLTAGGGEGPVEETATATDTAVTEATRADTAAPPRIAVLPFENIARDTGDAFFARGMHEEVLNQLSKVSDLEVISRTSVMQYAETNKTVGEISEELGGVNALLEGTVRRAGDQVRITTQLIEAPEDEHLWSNSYDRRLQVEEIFRIQADIAQEVAGALEARLTESEASRIREPPTASLDAYDAYLKGRNQIMRFWIRRDPAHLDPGIRNLRRAIQIDSAFAPAHAWLAQGFAARYFASRTERWRDSASASVERALELDPDLPEALNAKAFIVADSPAEERAIRERVLRIDPDNVLTTGAMSDIAWKNGDYGEAVRWARQAVRLDPRSSWHIDKLADRLARIGMWDEAQSWYGYAREIDPDAVGPVTGLVTVHTSLGQFHEAEEVLRSYRSRHPDHPFGLAMAGHIALYRGQPEAAVRHLRKVPEAQRRAYPEDSPSRPDEFSLDPQLRVTLGLAELRAGRRPQGRRILRQATDSLRTLLEGTDVPWRTELAAGLAALGREEAALRQLRRSMEEGEFVHPRSEGEPLFGDLRSNTEFQQILREMEAKQKRIRAEVRQLGIDLYPHGAEPDTGSRETTR